MMSPDDYRCQRCGSFEHPRLLLFVYAILLLALGAFLMHVHLTAKPLPSQGYRDEFYSVHVTDTKGRIPVDYLERHRLRGGDIVPLPTLYQVRYYDNGAMEDIGIAYQYWWRAKR